MRLPKVDNYENKNLIEVRQITEVPKVTRSVTLFSEKDKIKLIKTIEKLVRSSLEYKEYIQYLRDCVDMTMCSYFNNVSNKESRRVSIEIHHEPFTLFDIAQTVLEKWIQTEEELNTLLIAEEVMKIHYKNNVGLIPLSITVHELVHNGKLFIPLQNVYGNFITFLEEYDEYISDDLKDILELKLTMSKELQIMDTTILDKKYVYLEVDGMAFPQIIENTNEEVS